MLWYTLFLFISSLGYAGCVYLAFKFRKDKLDDFPEWSVENGKRVFLLWIATLLIITGLLSKPLVKTMSCQFDGWTANTETSYSWYKGQCLYKSKTGAWLPLGISRDQPQGDGHE